MCLTEEPEEPSARRLFFCPTITILDMTYSATRLTTSLLLAALTAVHFSAHAGLNEGLAAYDKDNTPQPCTS